MLNLAKRKVEDQKSSVMGHVALKRAWILDFDHDVKVAVGEREMIHLLSSPEIFELPQTPYYCRHTILWQGRILPLLDLGAWVAGRSLRHSHNIAGIVRYWDQASRELQYAALSLAKIPSRSWVSDDDACEMDGQARQWKSMASSCVRMNGEPVPILDLPVVFSEQRLLAR